jgi:hypothetical protein
MGTHGPAYATASSRASTRISRGIGIPLQSRKAIKKVKTMKLTFRQRFLNWLFEEKAEADDYSNHALSQLMSLSFIPKACVYKYIQRRADLLLKLENMIAVKMRTLPQCMLLQKKWILETKSERFSLWKV